MGSKNSNKNLQPAAAESRNKMKAKEALSRYKKWQKLQAPCVLFMYKMELKHSKEYQDKAKYFLTRNLLNNSAKEAQTLSQDERETKQQLEVYKEALRPQVSEMIKYVNKGSLKKKPEATESTPLATTTATNNNELNNSNNDGGKANQTPRKALRRLQL